MSVTQNAASPVSGGGWKGLSGWGKVAVGGVAVTLLAAFIIMPGLGGNTGDTTSRTKGDDVSNFEKFKPSHSAQGETTSAAATNFGAATAVRHLPPPIEIGSFIAPPPAAPQIPTSHPYPAGYGSQGAAPGGVTPVMVPMPATGAAPAPPPASSLESQVSGGIAMRTMTASVLPHPDYTITAGTKIPCTTVEAADSTLGGFYTCRVPEWVRGTTQRRGLLPAGTIIFGQMRKGMEQGQERVGILFTRIQTAGDNIVIPLTAPAADALGRPGMAGDIDTFFWDKVGDVALYALIDGIQGAITQGAATGISGLAGGKLGYLNLSTGGGQSLASMELQNRINRPPVMHINQGIPIEVSVGQDLDFYAACARRLRVNPMACPEQ